MIAATVPTHADDRTQAATHYKQGKAFFEAKQYPEAIAEYEAAYAIDKLPAHLFNIARAYHLAGNLPKAIEHYRKFLDADPNGAQASEARGYVVAATQELADADAKRKAKEAKDEIAAKRDLVQARLKQAEAFELAGAWSRAGDEYVAAAELAAEPSYLLKAAVDYRKQPALDKAQAAYRAYLDKVPTGATSDVARSELAQVTSEIDKANAAAKRTATTAPKAEDLAAVLDARDKARAHDAEMRLQRTRGHVRLYAAVGGGIVGRTFDGARGGPEDPAGDNGTPPALSPMAAIGVRRGFGPGFELQANLHAFYRPDSGQQTISDGFDGSPVITLERETLFAPAIDVTVRARPTGRSSSWYLGIGPIVHYVMARGEMTVDGTTTPFSGNHLAPGGVIETGFLVGKNENIEIAFRFAWATVPVDFMVPEPSTGGGALFDIGLQVGYTFF